MMQKTEGRQDLRLARWPHVLRLWSQQAARSPELSPEGGAAQNVLLPGTWVFLPLAECKATPTRAQRPPALPWGKGSLQCSVGEPGLLSQLFVARGRSHQGWTGQSCETGWQRHRTDADHVLTQQVRAPSRWLVWNPGDTEEGGGYSPPPAGPLVSGYSSRTHGSSRHLGNTLLQSGG